MKLRLEPIQVATGSNDVDGRLVFAGHLLVGVLVRLSEDHEGRAGTWFLEAAFGRLTHRRAPVFATLAEASDWLLRVLVEPTALGQMGHSGSA